MKLHRIVLRIALASSLIAGLVASPSAAPPPQGQELSSPALFSRFGRATSPSADAVLGRERAEGAFQLGVLLADSAKSGQANADWNMRPQNETTIALHPTDHRKWVIGANDYGIGTPIGTGVYSSDGVNYFPPFALLAATGVFPPPNLLLEPPGGTGDPALAYGLTRAAAGLPAGLPVVYMASLGFSFSFCENGLFVYRSLDNGKTWTRPVVPPLAPPAGLRTVVYHASGTDCSIFHDKEFIAVDMTHGPRAGRIYVTWTKFFFAGGVTYKESPIMLAFSDNNGQTFSSPIEVSGFSMALCPNQQDGPPGECDEDQGSVPVVLPDGKVAIAFINQQCPTCYAQGFRDQYLVTIFDPNTNSVAGPFKVADLFDGANDYPINEDGRQTLCNSNFRQWSAGNLAAAPDGKSLYVVWSDNRRHAGEFPFPTFVGPRAAGYPCPAGKKTDVDIFISTGTFTPTGMTWSAPVRVNQDTFANDRDQWFPWVAVAPDGKRVDVVFYDRRGDPGNKLTHTFLARSRNGGQTWRDFRVSDFASNFDNAFFGIGVFIGDYNALAIDRKGRSYPVWTGVRPGKMDSDVFFKIVGKGKDDDNDN